MAKKKSSADDAPDVELPAATRKKVLASLPAGTPDLGPIYAVKQDAASMLQNLETLGILTGVAVLFAFIFGAIHSTLRDDEKVIILIAGVVSGLAAVVGFGLMLYLNTIPYHSRGEHWLFFRDALVRLTWGRKADVYPWDRMKVLKVSTNPGDRRYELTAPSAGLAKFKYGITGAQLIWDIQDRQVRAALPGVLGAVAEGKVVKFGAVGVGKDGLTVARKEIPWENVKKLDFKSAMLEEWQVIMSVLPHMGKQALAEVDIRKDLPNAWLFFNVVEALQPQLFPDAKTRDGLKLWLA